MHCTPATQQAWDRIEKSHWQHSWEYIELQKYNNRYAQAYLIQNSHGETLGYFVHLVIPLYRKCTISYLPYGPVWIIPPDHHDESLVLSAIRSLAETSSSIALRLHPSCQHRTTRMLPAWAYGRSFMQAQSEAVLELGNTPTDVLVRVSRSTRRNITKALKQALDIQIVTGTDILNYGEDFITIEKNNARHHQISSLSADYLSHAFATVAHNRDNILVVARQADKICAMHIITIFGTHAYTPYGTSTLEGKKCGAYYALKWQTVDYLIKRGVTTWNWGGVQSGNYDRHLGGVTQFKQGWGTRVRTHRPVGDLVIHCLWYWIYMLRTWMRYQKKVLLNTLPKVTARD